jgi:hypothetical protein
MEARAERDAPVCIWSNRADPDTRQVEVPSSRVLAKARVQWVCPEHHQQLKNFVERAEREQPQFLAAIAVSVAGSLLPLFLDSVMAYAVPLLLLGLALVRYPYAAPLTVSRNGIAGSIRALRVSGAILIIVGLLFAGLGVAWPE